MLVSCARILVATALPPLVAGCGTSGGFDRFVLSGCTTGRMMGDTATLECSLTAQTRHPRWIFVPDVPGAPDASPDWLSANSEARHCWPPSVGDMACYTVQGPSSSYRLMRTNTGISTGTLWAMETRDEPIEDLTLWLSRDGVVEVEWPALLDAAWRTYDPVTVDFPRH